MRIHCYLAASFKLFDDVTFQSYKDVKSTILKSNSQLRLSLDNSIINQLNCTICLIIRRQQTATTKSVIMLAAYNCRRAVDKRKETNYIFIQRANKMS